MTHLGDEVIQPMSNVAECESRSIPGEPEGSDGEIDNDKEKCNYHCTTTRVRRHSTLKKFVSDKIDHDQRYS